MAWGAAERAQWLSRQRKLRSYADEVVSRIERLVEFDVQEYGQLDYPPDHYRSLRWQPRRDIARCSSRVCTATRPAACTARCIPRQRAADIPSTSSLPCVNLAYEHSSLNAMP